MKPIRIRIQIEDWNQNIGSNVSRLSSFWWKKWMWGLSIPFQSHLVLHEAGDCSASAAATHQQWQCWAASENFNSGFNSNIPGEPLGRCEPPVPHLVPSCCINVREPMVMLLKYMSKRKNTKHPRIWSIFHLQQSICGTSVAQYAMASKHARQVETHKIILEDQRVWQQ